MNSPEADESDPFKRLAPDGVLRGCIIILIIIMRRAEHFLLVKVTMFIANCTVSLWCHGCIIKDRKDS